MIKSKTLKFYFFFLILFVSTLQRKTLKKSAVDFKQVFRHLGAFTKGFVTALIPDSYLEKIGDSLVEAACDIKSEAHEVQEVIASIDIQDDQKEETSKIIESSPNYITIEVNEPTQSGRLQRCETNARLNPTFFAKVKQLLKNTCVNSKRYYRKSIRFNISQA